MHRRNPLIPAHRWHSLAIVSLAIAGTTALAISPTFPRALPTQLTRVHTVLAEANLLSTELWVIGGSGDAIPSADPTHMIERYIDPAAFPHFSNGHALFTGQPQFTFDASNSLFTPEGLEPVTPGVKSLAFDPSLAQGVTILNSTIMQQLAAGNKMIIEGDSQGADVEGVEMRALLALPKADQPGPDELTFVTTGNEMNPDGGILERFNLPGMPQLTIPAFEITFIGASPADTPWTSVEYIGEYDGFADYPRYPIDLLSDINAVLGMGFVHLRYTSFTAAHLATAIELPTSAGYTGHAEYFMIPQTLPLVDLLQVIPVVGKPLADLLGPDLAVLVNLGYGDIDYGWDQGPANVPTPIGLFPTVNPADVLTALVKGAQQGVENFTHDLGSVTPQSLLEQLAPAGGAGSGDALPSFIDIANTFSSDLNTFGGDLDSGYAGLFPVANFVNTLTTTLPAYDASLFVHELSSGNLIDAIGMPIATDIGLVPPLSVFGLAGIVEGIAAIFNLHLP